jgi:hypothetical protein
MTRHSVSVLGELEISFLSTSNNLPFAGRFLFDRFLFLGRALGV